MNTLVHISLIALAMISMTGLGGLISFQLGYNYRKLGIPLTFLLFGVDLFLLLTSLHYIESLI